MLISWQSHDLSVWKKPMVKSQSGSILSILESNSLGSIAATWNSWNWNILWRSTGPARLASRTVRCFPCQLIEHKLIQIAAGTNVTCSVPTIGCKCTLAFLTCQTKHFGVEKTQWLVGVFHSFLPSLKIQQPWRTLSHFPLPHPCQDAESELGTSTTCTARVPHGCRFLQRQLLWFFISTIFPSILQLTIRLILIYIYLLYNSKKQKTYWYMSKVTYHIYSVVI